MRKSDLGRLLEGDGSGWITIPLGQFGSAGGAEPLFPDGTMRLVREDGDTGELWATGRAQLALETEPVAARAEFHCPDGEVSGVALTLGLPGVDVGAIGRMYGYELPRLPAPPVTGLSFRGDTDGFALVLEGFARPGGILHRNGSEALVLPVPGGHVLVTRTDLPADQVEELGLPCPGPLPAGLWLALPNGTVVPITAPRSTARDPSGATDGLGRPKTVVAPVPYTQHTHPGLSSRSRAVPTEDGFAVLNPPRSPGPGTTWRPGGKLDGEQGIEIVYRKNPLTITGALQVQDAQAPYRAVVGGLLTLAFGGGEPGKRGLYGMGTGAVVFPEGSGTDASFFGFAAFGAEPGIGIPAFRLRGMAAGFGWNSHLRTPGLADLHTFPFLEALQDPSAIGGDDTDPVRVLNTLTSGTGSTPPWITAKRGDLWVTAGIAFTIGELIDGTAMALVQTGSDLAIALLGTAGTSFPTKGDKKYARIDAGLQLVVKPNSGELTVAASVNPSSFVISEDCKLRGGVGLTIWYGDHPNAGDFVFSVGGYHKEYHVPEYYPQLPRLGFDWSLGGKVTISGSAYFALTPRAAMAGGALDVRYSAGVIKAWCTAAVDVLIEWNPFYIDASLSLSIGVEGSVKVLFVRITVRLEVGVSLRIWGPPTGGEARVKVWFVSFTIGFGQSRRGSDNDLDWPGTRAMLPEPGARARLRPGDGLVTEGSPDDPWQGDWLVKASGFTFGTDTQVPLTRVELATRGEDVVIPGRDFGVHPMRVTEFGTTQRIEVTLEGERVDLDRWNAVPQYTALPPQMWDKSGDPEHGDGQVQYLTGVTLSSGDPDYGGSTGYIGENTFKFDPVYPYGVAPLGAGDRPLVPAPTRPGGVVGRIQETVDAAGQRAARAKVHALMDGLGLDTGGAKAELPGYADMVTAVFTAEPLLVPAGAVRTPEGEI
ncbi:hypothetical protein GTY20_38935 [Streptomyces sp. SID4946]|uniref:DUF6603 domain-containing protein n=1 Tax=Streptomyces sp. LamerLS-31b TaxID=1839765 RepID=UPI00081F264D|nr:MULTISPECIES: DUF6603 domain-containing protein [unclassified Streptomyces]MYQ96778.1 hypothetical protein [Streptomyces sp. SID4946]SCF62235.1 hypothetical protein GA0115258_10486 [Streptomyces sp. LamerLS-31b]SCG02040.1 hypothetical protein GA0115256_14468 [Streptomyces sp. DconLS]